MGVVEPSAPLAPARAAEPWSPRSAHLQSRMFVDISRDEKLAIHLNMTFPHLPCGVASLDKQDAMGLHEMDVVSLTGLLTLSSALLCCV